MFYRLARMAARWCRCWRTLGFGVQSPSAYRFVRYVIGERAPYYAYDDLAAAFPHQSRPWRAYCRLCFRLANYAQADEWIAVAPLRQDLQAYVAAGCRRSRVVPHPTEGSRRRVFYIEASTAEWAGCEEALSRAGEGTLILVVGISAGRHARHLWQRLRDDARTGTAYDLYDLGIVCFDRLHPKRVYKVNY